MDRAAHPGVADESRAMLENLFVGRLHVRVRPEDGRDATIEIPPDGDFLARCLPVRIDHDERRLGAHRGHRGVEHRERILQDRLHEGARLHVDHAHLSFRRLEHDRARARRTGRIIERTQQAGFCLDEGHDLLPVPDVIASRDDRSSGAQEVDRKLRRDAAPGGCVLAIHDDEIERPVALQFRQARDHRAASWLADNVAEEKNREHAPIIVLNSKIPN